MVVTEPRRIHETAATLSERVAEVISRQSTVAVSMSWWVTTAASSKSEMLMEPPGLEAETSRAERAAGKRRRQRSGACWAPGNQTPPMPTPEASQAPVGELVVWWGTSLWKRVGRVLRLLARA